MANGRIYTRGGDKGETGTVDGQRVSKADPWIELYGEVDELNSWVGLLHASMERAVFTEESTELEKIQNRLFDLGSNLACKKDARTKFKLPQLSQVHVSALETGIDRMTVQLTPLKHFILPGGHPAA